MYSIPYEKGIFIPWGETIYGHPQSFDMQLLAVIICMNTWAMGKHCTANTYLQGKTCYTL